MIQVIWFKRDLRLHDHAPLCEATSSGLPTLLLYVFEPSLMQAPDYDQRHARFVWQSLQHLQQQLGSKTQILILKGEVVEILEAINREQQIGFLYSHLETGNGVSFERDKLVKLWCKQKGTIWKEWSDRGIVRGLQHRNKWPQQWYGYMHSPMENPDLNNLKTINLPDFNNVVNSFTDLYPNVQEPNPKMQPGGSHKGYLYLNGFLQDRSKNYPYHISKPELSRTSCSRLSPYLAYGCLSIKEVYQSTRYRLQEAPHLKRQLEFFLERLRWHSHFIQKLESKPAIEFDNTNRAFNSVRNDVDLAKIEAWKQGKTGYPLVDACMRSVQETGYLNFRMRAMLVSFLTHHLWQPWQAGVHHLAQLFLDYEPGIHFPQFQMQAGVTGINTIRIYNPVKQGQDHDAEGIFIKKWLPELKKLNGPLLQTPWQLTTMEQQQAQCIIGHDYPNPIVTLESAAKHAREQLWSIKKSPGTRHNNKKILGTLSNRRDENENGA